MAVQLVRVSVALVAEERTVRRGRPGSFDELAGESASTQSGRISFKRTVDDGMWLGELRFEMDVRSPAGDIMGPYNGQGSYAVDLGMSEDVGVLAGSAQGAWVGPMNFSPCSVKKFHFSYTPTEGGIKPGLGFWLSAEGDFTPTEVTPFEVSLGSDVFSGTADLSPFAPGLVPMTLFISESGATIEIADHQFKGFVIGTLAEEPSE